MSEDMTNVNVDLDRATEILMPMIDAGASNEDMVVALIQAGIKYARAGRLMMKVLESKGLRVSAKDRYAAASENLTNWEFAPETWADVEDAVANLVEELDSTNTAQALSCVKRFAKEHEITLPEKPKTGGRRDGSSADARFYAWAVANKDASEADVKAFVDALGVTENQAPRYLAAFTERLAFARAFAKA